MVRMWPAKWRLILGLTMIAALVIGGLSIAPRSHDAKTDINTVLQYAPAICTQDLAHSQCGDVRITVRTGAGEIRVFHYAGNQHPEKPTTMNLVEFYKPGTKLQITTSESDGAVVRVERIGH
ncbi:MAG: hypothetical protein QOJ35_2103 [Solirubrobacteraceae bacterium]|nr:hypothetical protein [Solirubrobacteraceae bacterium]